MENDSTIQQISELIRGQDANEKPGETDSQSDGKAIQANNDGGDDARTGAVDQPESNGPESIQDDSEIDAQATDEGGSAEDIPVTLSTLAEHLGIESADLYEVEIPVGNGESVSLSELKDNFKEYGPANEYSAKIKEREETLEKQLLQTRSELSRLMSFVPENVRNSMIEAARDSQQAWEKDQHNAVLEAVPEWKDSDARASDRDAIVGMLSEYGFSAQEVGYTQDARTLRFMRDAMRDRKRLAELETAAKKQPGRASAPGKSGRQTSSKKRLAALLQRGKQAHSMQAKSAVVSELIRNQ